MSQMFTEYSSIRGRIRAGSRVLSISDRMVGVVDETHENGEEFVLATEEGESMCLGLDVVFTVTDATIVLICEAESLHRYRR